MPLGPDGLLMADLGDTELTSLDEEESEPIPCVFPPACVLLPDILLSVSGNPLNSSYPWNDRLAEIWTLISTSPENFKGGGVWSVIVNINDGLKAVGYALLALLFVMGVVKMMGSFADENHS